VALAAVTVRVDEAPATIEAGLAAMLTLGITVSPIVAAPVFVPQPARDITTGRTVHRASKEARQLGR
jgi:hypothetical protein